MPIHRHPRTAAAWLLAAFAFAPAAHAAKEKADTSSLITDAKGLTFSGFERTGAGRRRWTLTADTAAPADDSGKRWTIAGLNLGTVDAAGKPGIRVIAPAATFDQATRSAADPGPLALTGDRVALTGKNWSWHALENHDNRIEIREEVRVTLSPNPTKADKRGPIRIAADRLVALTDAKGGITLTFAGNVRVHADEVTLQADTITTVVRAAADATALPSADRHHAVDIITAEGGVKVSRRGGVITGDRAEMTPGTGVYAVTGNTRFTDLSDRRVSVAGSAMRYDSKAHRVVVAPGDDGRVHAELPALDNRSEAAGDAARANASARELSIDIAPTRHRLALEGDVRVTDPLNALTCGRLTVETPRRETGFASVGVPATGVSRVIAEESVELTRDGRTLRCDRIEALPPRHRVILSGNPRGEDPAHRATIKAALMTLDTERQTLTAESAPDRPVQVTLADHRAGATQPYAMDAALLLVSRHDAGATFEFEGGVTLAGHELSGSCDRLGIEVEGPAKGPTASGRVRRIVAAGAVRLTQAAYTATAARAEILPGAALREIMPAENNGLDGASPSFVTLESDLPAGVRTAVTLPAPAIPRLSADGPLVPDTNGSDPGPLTLKADFQELVAGRERVRAFARGAVAVDSPGLVGSCASLEMRAIANPPAGATVDHKFITKGFLAEAIVARGDVRMRIGERRASGDTLEILPLERSITLIGNPNVTGWPTPAGVTRKTIRWSPGTDDSGQTATRIRLADEATAGMPGQIIRPRLTLPAEMSADLGRSFRKSLDKKAP